VNKGYLKRDRLYKRIDFHCELLQMSGLYELDFFGGKKRNGETKKGTVG